jgi:hypothetical protein
MTPEAWTAWGTWATTLIAGAAAVFAYRQVREARTLREAQAQPFIVVTLEPSAVMSNLIMLRVENVGHTLARDVRFTFDPPLSSMLATKSDGYSLTEGSLLTEGLTTMPPAMRIERIFDNSIDWGKDGENQPVLAYDVEVTFSDHKGKPQEPLNYRIDLSPYLSGHYIETRSIHHVADALRDIRTYLKGWGEFQGGLKVYTRDGDTKDERRRHSTAELREKLKAREAQERAAEPESTGEDGPSEPSV